MEIANRDRMYNINYIMYNINFRTHILFLINLQNGVCKVCKTLLVFARTIRATHLQRLTGT